MTKARRRPALPAARRPSSRRPAAGHAREASGRDDAGPAERYQHGDIIRTEPGDTAGVQVRRVLTQSTLDRYFARDQVSQRQFDAGLKLFRLWRASGGGQRVTAAYGPRVQASHDLTDAQAALRSDVTDLLRRMGPLAGILVHVCLCDEAARDWAVSRGDAPQAGIVVLRLGLDALADHWRL